MNNRKTGQTSLLTNRPILRMADLQALADRYASDESGSALKVMPGTDGLVFHLEGSSGKGSEIRAIAPTRFR